MATFRRYITLPVLGEGVATPSLNLSKAASVTLGTSLIPIPLLRSPPLIPAAPTDSLLHAAWPDNDVDMGSGLVASRLEEMQSTAGGLLPPLGAGADEGFGGPQQAFAALVARRFKVSRSCH